MNKLSFIKMIKEKTKSEIYQVISDRKKDLMSFRFKSKLGELNNTSLFKKARVEIAIAYTELNKRKTI